MYIYMYIRICTYIYCRHLCKGLRFEGLAPALSDASCRLMARPCRAQCLKPRDLRQLPTIVFRGLGFRVKSLGFRVKSLGFRV